MMRIIDKLPRTPKLNEKLVRMITGLLFLRDARLGNSENYGKIEPETVLQIMGNIAFLDDMFNGNKLNVEVSSVPRLVISGGINPAYRDNTKETALVKQLYTSGGKRDWNDVLTKPEAKIINDRLNQNKYNPFVANTYLETTSTNLRENITFSKERGFYTGAKNLYLFTTKENTLRAVATARKYLPDMKNISSMSYTPTVPTMGVRVDEDNWANTPISQSYVYGEFLRVVKYYETNEILLTETENSKMFSILREFEKTK